MGWWDSQPAPEGLFPPDGLELGPECPSGFSSRWATRSWSHTAHKAGKHVCAQPALWLLWGREQGVTHIFRGVWGFLLEAGHVLRENADHSFSLRRREWSERRCPERVGLLNYRCLPSGNLYSHGVCSIEGDFRVEGLGLWCDRQQLCSGKSTELEPRVCH